MIICTIGKSKKYVFKKGGDHQLVLVADDLFSDWHNLPRHSSFPEDGNEHQWRSLPTNRQHELPLHFQRCPSQFDSFIYEVKLFANFSTLDLDAFSAT